jgi:hypothetical protein
LSFKKSGEEYIFELAGYLVTCAAMALSGEREGSPRYSANRFLIALRKLVDSPEYVEGLEEDPFLRGIVEKLDDIKLEHDQLQDLQMEFAVEASKRLD